MKQQGIYAICTAGEDRESYSVFYSTIVQAEDENDAVLKYIMDQVELDPDTDCEELFYDFLIKCDLDPADPYYNSDDYEGRLDIVEMPYIN